MVRLICQKGYTIISILWYLRFLVFIFVLVLQESYKFNAIEVVTKLTHDVNKIIPKTFSL